MQMTFQSVPPLPQPLLFAVFSNDQFFTESRASSISLEAITCISQGCQWKATLMFFKGNKGFCTQVAALDPHLGKPLGNDILFT